MNTHQQVKTTSGVFQTKSLSRPLEIFILIVLGMFAMLLHAKLRIPMKLPGHHGIEFMALVMAGRMISKHKFASVFSSLGVAFMAFMPSLGFKDPFMAFVFLLPGMFLDIFYTLIPNAYKKIYLIAIAGAFAHAMVPIARMIISAFTGWPYGSLLTGIVYPYSLWWIFGFIGSFIGAGIVYKLRKK